MSPTAGQYVPIAPTLVLSTQSGLGVPGGTTGAIAGGSTIAPIPVTGVGAIPNTGVESVFLNVLELSASGSGFASVYGSDIANTSRAIVSFNGSAQDNGSAIVTVAGPGAVSPGTIALTDNGTSSSQFKIYVEGYFTDGTDQAADTLVSMPWTTIIDTRNGTGTTQQQLGYDQSITFPVLGSTNNTGVPSGDVGAAEVEIGALNATANGWLKLTGSLGSPPYATLSYESGVKTRVTEIVAPNSSGNVTIENTGTQPVDVQIVLRGIFITPPSSEAGSAFVPVLPQAICDTRTSCPGNTVQAVPANQSITVQETGVADIPTTDVSAVADEIDAVSPTATGWLTVNPSSNPTQSSVAAVNFTYGVSGENVSFDNTIISTPSSTGSVTITNKSSGTVQIVVYIEGYWLGATVPDVPMSVDSTFDGTSANVVWNAPDTDGGATITGYLVTDVNTNVATSVDGATFTGSVAASPGDEVTVAAENAMGYGAASAPIPVAGITDNGSLAASLGASSDAQNALNAPQTTPMTPCASEPNPAPVGTVSGIVEYGGSETGVGGQLVANDTVDITLDDATLSSSIMPSLGSVQTDANGCFWYTIPTPTGNPNDPASEVVSVLNASPTNSANLVFSASGVVTTSTNGTFQLNGTVETPDSNFAGGNANASEAVIQLFPEGGGSLPSGTVSPNIVSARSISHAVTAATPLAKVLRGFIGVRTLTSREISHYGFNASRSFDPYDVDGFNLKNYRVQVNVRGGMPLHKDRARERKLRLLDAKIRFRLSHKLNAHYVISSGSGGCDYDAYYVAGEPDPAGSICVEICNAKPTTTPQNQYGWIPAAQTNMAVAGEKGSATITASQAFSGTVALSVSGSYGIARGAGSVSIGSTQEHGTSITSPVQTYKGGPPNGGGMYDVDVPVYWHTYATTVGCASFLTNSQTAADPFFSATAWQNGGTPGYGIGLYDVLAQEPDYSVMDAGEVVQNTLAAYINAGVFPNSALPGGDPGTLWRQASKWLATNYIETYATTNYGTAAESIPNGEYPTCVPGNLGIVNPNQSQSQQIATCIAESQIAGETGFHGGQPAAARGAGFRPIWVADPAPGTGCPNGAVVCGDGNFWEEKAYAELNDYGYAQQNWNYNRTTNQSQSYSVAVTIGVQGPLFGASLTTTFSWMRSSELGESVIAPGEFDYYFANVKESQNEQNYDPLVSGNGGTTAPEVFAGYAGPNNHSPQPPGWTCSDFNNTLPDVCPPS